MQLKGRQMSSAHMADWYLHLWILFLSASTWDGGEVKSQMGLSPFQRGEPLDYNEECMLTHTRSLTLSTRPRWLSPCPHTLRYTLFTFRDARFNKDTHRVKECLSHTPTNTPALIPSDKPTGNKYLFFWGGGSVSPGTGQPALLSQKAAQPWMP